MSTATAAPPSSAQHFDITGLLQEWRICNVDVLNKLIPLVYHELRLMARHYLTSNHQPITLQPTALVHEAYQQLIGGKDLVFENRTHFFRCARLIMRQVLIRYARMRGSLKRGGHYETEEFQENLKIGEFSLNPELLLALDQALDKLESFDPRKRQVIELRFFMGLTFEEMGQVMSLSPRTLKREWQTAQVWLARELKPAC